jgi:hypothetical protein
VLLMISVFARFITRPRGEDGRHTVITQSPSAGIGVDRAGGITLHFGAWRCSSPPDSNSKP